MRSLRSLLAASLCVASCFPANSLAATFGTVVAPAGGAAYSDIVLDQPRSLLYLVASTINQVSVYSTAQKAYLSPIATDNQPVAAAMSLDGHHLYVTCYASAVLDVVDLTTDLVTTRVSLPSSPEGVAVGGDGRVLITGVPATTGSTSNTLMIYDPTVTTSISVVPVPIPPSAPTPATLPAPSNRVFNSYDSRLIASPDGKLIIGANGTSTTGKVVFVYEVASGTVLRSRAVTSLSSTLSVSPDGSKFMAGSILFSTTTLQVIAQENAANAPFSFSFTTGSNFNTQLNQGGSIFSPDGTALYAAFNVAPTGASRPNVSQLLVNDPDNLLITLGLQMPENLTGKMVIDSTGSNIYALSDSGFTALPIGSIANSPLAQPDSRVVRLTSDICGAYAAQNTAAVPVDNLGKGRFTATVSAASTTTTVAVPGVGGVFGIGIPGIGAPGFGPGGAGGGAGGGGGVFAGAGGGTITVTTTPTNYPSASVTNTATGATVNFRFNPSAAVSPGTTGPSDFVVQSPEAINIPGNIHTYQNNRAPESAGTVMPVQLNASAGEGLTDIVLDSVRRRLYIANAGMNRVEVFDIGQQQFLTPIKVGQLPQAMAMSVDGGTLYVANTGGESISIVNLTTGLQTGLVVFPALPFNASITAATPQAIAASARGPEFVMSDGSLWKVDGNQAIPRPLNPAVFGSTAKTVSGGTGAGTFWTMTATPAGEYVVLLTGAGNAYLYNYTLDDYTLVKQVLATPLTGYVGTLSAGPKGAYYQVGGMILDSSLTPVAGGTNSISATGRNTGAVAAISATQAALFTTPVRSSATAAVTDAGQIEIYNPATGTPQLAAPTLEGPPSTVVGTTRTLAFPRTLAVDTAGGNAYAITVSGLSIVSLQTGTNAGSRPSINNGGVVSLADYTPAVGSGGLVTIFGNNLTNGTSSSAAPLPTVAGGTCVTLNNQPLPMALASPGQINAQIPIGMAAGRYPLVVRSIANQVASASTTVTVSKYAPAVLVGGGGQPAIFHLDGSYVNKDNPGNRDETLMIFATGLGPTTGGKAATGAAAPTSPLAQICSGPASCAVSVYFGPPAKDTAIIVDWAGLAPGLTGIYQLNVTVPGTHASGNSLPVTLEIGGASSSDTGPVAPTIAVN